MVYVGRDGRVYDQRPWDMSRVVDMFKGFFALILFFFQSLIEPLQAIGGGNQSGGGARRSGGGGGSGGGNDRRPPGPPNRRIGRITTMADCNVPGGG